LALNLLLSDPVTIPDSEEPKKLKLLSNGEIELEPEDLNQDATVLSRRRRSVDRSSGDTGKRVSDVNSRLNTGSHRSPDKNVETLVVADRDMIRNHARDRRDVTTYILTVMNMVSFNESFLFVLKKRIDDRMAFCCTEFLRSSGLATASTTKTLFIFLLAGLS